MTIRIADPRTDPEPAGWAPFQRKTEPYPVWDYDLMRLEAWLATAWGSGEVISAMSVLVGRPRLSPRFAPVPDTRTVRPLWAEVYQPWLIGCPSVVFAPGFGDRKLAANTMLDHPECPALQHWTALSVEEGGRQHCYFDAYVRGVRYMAQKGCKKLSARRGMLELETSLGFSPRGVHAVAVPRPVLGR